MIKMWRICQPVITNTLWVPLKIITSAKRSTCKSIILQSHSLFLPVSLTFLTNFCQPQTSWQTTYPRRKVVWPPNCTFWNQSEQESHGKEVARAQQWNTMLKVTRTHSSTTSLRISKRDYSKGRVCWIQRNCTNRSVFVNLNQVSKVNVFIDANMNKALQTTNRTLCFPQVQHTLQPTFANNHTWKKDPKSWKQQSPQPPFSPYDKKHSQWQLKAFRDQPSLQ